MSEPQKKSETESVNALVEQAKPSARRPKIRFEDCDLVAQLVAKRLTETEACAVLGLNPAQWYNWKTKRRNEGRFDAELARIRGSKVRACIETLEEAGTRTNPKTGMIDWRAHDRLLDRLDPQRFGPQPMQINNVVQVHGLSNDLVDAARQVFLKRSETPQPVVSCGQPSQPVTQPSTLLVQDAECVPVKYPTK